MAKRLVRGFDDHAATGTAGDNPQRVRQRHLEALAQRKTPFGWAIASLAKARQSHAGEGNIVPDLPRSNVGFTHHFTKPLLYDAASS